MVGAYLLRMADGGGFDSRQERGICCRIDDARVRRGIYNRIGYIIVCWCLGWLGLVRRLRKLPYLLRLVLLSMRAIGACRYVGLCGIVQYVPLRLRMNGVPRLVML